MVIKKVSNTKYIAEVTDEEIIKIKSFIDYVSLGTMDEYEESNNNILFDRLLCRQISAEIGRRDIKFPDTGFIIVDTLVNGRSITASVGRIVMDKTLKVSDVIYL